MSVVATLVYALTQGLSSALPLSPSGHRLVLRIWLETPARLEALEIVAEVGTLFALAVFTRHRLLRALSDGVRGIARPARLRSTEGGRDAVAVMLMAAAAISSEILLLPYVREVNQVPLVVAGGLLLTAAALLSTLVAPSPRRLVPPAWGALLSGLGFGFSVMPGASSMAVAFAVMRWLGVAHVRAAEMAMMVAVLVLGVRTSRALVRSNALAAVSAGDLALAVVAAFVGATLGAEWWRALCEKRRTPRLALWLVPLGLAVLSYGRALAS